mgnify:CR=1 FL=1
MDRAWRVAIVKDTSRPMLGLHALHVGPRGLPGVDVVALVDGNPRDLERKVAATGARRHYPALAPMLAAERPDVVILCSRHPDDHLPQITAAAEAGCHIYCEKPLCASLDEADQIIALAERHGVYVSMAHPARHALAWRTMAQRLAAGHIGRPLTAIARGKCDHRGGGEDLVVLGTHMLDAMAWMLGPPSAVGSEVSLAGRPVTRADRATTVEPIGPCAGDHVYAWFRFANDVRGVFESRRGLFTPPGPPLWMGLTICGTEGALSMRFCDSAEPRPQLLHSAGRGPLEDHHDWQPVELIEHRSIAGAQPLDYALCGQPDIPGARFFLEANRFALWDLLGAIEQKRQPECNAQHARTVVEMIQGIYAAHLERRVVTFPLAERRHPLTLPDRPTEPAD